MLFCNENRSKTCQKREKMAKNGQILAIFGQKLKSNRTGIRTPCHEVFSYLLWTSTWQCPYISDVIHQLNPNSTPDPFLEKLVPGPYFSSANPKRCAGRKRGPGVPPHPPFFGWWEGMGIDLRSISHSRTHPKKGGCGGTPGPRFRPAHRFGFAEEKRRFCPFLLNFGSRSGAAKRGKSR